MRRRTGTTHTRATSQTGKRADGDKEGGRERETDRHREQRGSARETIRNAPLFEALPLVSNARTPFLPKTLPYLQTHASPGLSRTPPNHQPHAPLPFQEHPLPSNARSLLPSKARPKRGGGSRPVLRSSGSSSSLIMTHTIPAPPRDAHAKLYLIGCAFFFVCGVGVPCSTGVLKTSHLF